MIIQPEAFNSVGRTRSELQQGGQHNIAYTGEAASCLATARVESYCRHKTPAAQCLNELIGIAIDDNSVLDGNGLEMSAICFGKVFLPPDASRHRQHRRQRNGLRWDDQAAPSASLDAPLSAIVEVRTLISQRLHMLCYWSLQCCYLTLFSKQYSPQELWSRGTRGSQNDLPNTPLFCASKNGIHSAFDHIWGILEYRGSREFAPSNFTSCLKGKSESTM